jgi:D-beta-D-heptose 7-phosphate kinase/D-beta-D-heptose 1-phosphate adenosyltransferase|tara:strand:+ start:122 stop:601 length:480 start_codon:yes stop_codon:yes gene_type:complete
MKSINKKYLIKDLIIQINLLKKNDNIVIGFTNGCFDLLHKGHLHILSEAKKRCDYLIVAVNSDLSVKLLKGKNRPIDNESVRLSKLSSVKDVDALLIFAEETPLNTINGLLPDILFKGYDYKYKEVVGSEIVIKNGGKIEFIDFLDGFSTTNIIKNSSI